MLPKIEFHQDFWPEVYASRQNRSVITWPVIGVEEHNDTPCLVVGKERIKGLIPLEEVGIKEGATKRATVARLMNFIGQEIAIVVLSTDKQNNIFIGSRQTAAKKLSAVNWDKLQPGNIREAIARRIIKRAQPDGTYTDTGVLVEVEGIETLLPISELSHGWVGAIEDMIQPGETFDVMILEVDKEKEILHLSVKALFENPWPDCVSRYSKEGIYRGTVDRVVHYGIFVSLEPGVSVLCNHPKSGTLKETDKVAVVITHIDEEKKRIKGIISRVLWRS